MECIDAHIATGDSFFALFYEERAQGDHLSRIYHFSGRREPEFRLVAEIEEWLVSIWANLDGALFAAVWDGRILRIDPVPTDYANTDLLGTIKLAGFGAEPLFLMGDDGLIFENRGRSWQAIPLTEEPDIYSVARRDRDAFLFCGSDGCVIEYVEGRASVEGLPTDLDLHGIAFLDSETGLAVGDQGVAFLYQSGAWSDISVDKPCLADVHAFRGTFLVSVESESVEQVQPDGTWSTVLDRPGYFLSSNEAFCLTFFEKAAHLYDGAAWVSVPFGDLVTS